MLDRSIMLREGCSNYISILLPRQRQYFTGSKEIELAELKKSPGEIWQLD